MIESRRYFVDVGHVACSIHKTVNTLHSHRFGLLDLILDKIVTIVLLEVTPKHLRYVSADQSLLYARSFVFE